VCRRLYSGARSLADTAAIDYRVVGGTRQPALTCGDLRLTRETDPPR
jgi:hypothetical protein